MIILLAAEQCLLGSILRKIKANTLRAKKMTDVELQIYKLTEHIANLEAEVALLNNAVSAQPTLRDQFAMAALVGLASGNGFYSPCDIAKYSYMAADAMLKEREK